MHNLQKKTTFRAHVYHVKLAKRVHNYKTQWRSFIGVTCIYLLILELPAYRTGPVAFTIVL